MTMSASDNQAGEVVRAHLQELLDALQRSQVVIFEAQTGSGKSTQIPPFLQQNGYAERGVIACTQPRRIAASSLSRWVASDQGSGLGDVVGYTVRFDNQTTTGTQVKYLTDGMLLHEAMYDAHLSRYSVILLDEAHERTLASDVLLGLLKPCLKRRPELRLVIMSATLSVDKFRNMFECECECLQVPGRSHPVQIDYETSPVRDYLEAAVDKVVDIHFTEPLGDILVFLTGQAEIKEAEYSIKEKLKYRESSSHTIQKLEVTALYAALDDDVQHNIFNPAPPNTRKCIVATNIAETSVTIPGIVYVVDCGYHKRDFYDPTHSANSLIVVPTSKMTAQQRAGRAGRTRPGKCFRLYTELAFQDACPDECRPAMQRSNLASTVLQMKALGVTDLRRFDWLDAPPPATVLRALETLYALGAVDEAGGLTPFGEKVSFFPLDPEMATVLLRSAAHGCAREVVALAAMVSADAMQHRCGKCLWHPLGDHLTLLRLFFSSVNCTEEELWGFCSANRLGYSAMSHARQVFNQLKLLMQRCEVQYCEATADQPEKVVEALLEGYAQNIAQADGEFGDPGLYTVCSTGHAVWLHPSSQLVVARTSAPQWVVFHSAMWGRHKLFAHCVTAVPAVVADSEAFALKVARYRSATESAFLVSDGWYTEQAVMALGRCGWLPDDGLTPDGPASMALPVPPHKRTGLECDADHAAEAALSAEWGVLQWSDDPAPWGDAALGVAASYCPEAADGPGAPATDPWAADPAPGPNAAAAARAPADAAADRPCSPAAQDAGSRPRSPDSSPDTFWTVRSQSAGPCALDRGFDGVKVVVPKEVRNAALGRPAALRPDPEARVAPADGCGAATAWARAAPPEPKVRVEDVVQWPTLGGPAAAERRRKSKGKKR